MNPFPVVIDNDSLSHIAFIHTKFPILYPLRNVFSAVHIPDEVFLEFERADRNRNPERQKIIDYVNNSSRFWRKCTSYDTIVKDMVASTKGIDSGEAGAIAQHLKIQSRFLITEDKLAKERIGIIFPNVKIIKVKHVLAILDLHGYLNDWKGCITTLHQRRRITSKELRSAYAEMAQYYGIYIDKSHLSEKTSLKRMGISIR